VPVGPVQPEPAKEPQKWAGRVIVPGAVGPGQQKKAAAPLAATQRMMAYSQPASTRIVPRSAVPPPVPVRRRRRRGRFRRFLGAVFALILLLAVPVVSAYVSYKLSLGESPFSWPPTMDLSRVF